jgi:DsbC/DsbD-like thiol-disulfide interchange protein
MPAHAPILALLALSVAFAPPAVAPAQAQAAPAGVSPWSDDHASRARLLGGEVEDGARWAGLEIEMDPGYKTYWRHPGDSGIPAEFDWTGSRNVASVEIAWPAPGRFEDPFGAYYGYLDHVVLPLKVTPEDPTEPAVLSLSLFYGVCKEICIPATAEASLTLPPEPIASEVAIARALEAVPTPTPLGETDGPLAVLAVEPAGEDALGVRVRAPEGAILLAEGPDDRWFLAPGAAPDAAGVFTVEIAHAPKDAAGPVPVRLTLVAGEDAIEVETLASLPE